MRRSVLMFGCLVLLALGSVSYAGGERGYMGVWLDSAPLPELLTKHLGLEPARGFGFATSSPTARRIGPAWNGMTSSSPCRARR